MRRAPMATFYKKVNGFFEKVNGFFEKVVDFFKKTGTLSKVHI
jgi:hypothetical protein